MAVTLEVHDDTIAGSDGYLFLHSGSNHNLAYVTFDKIYPVEELRRLAGEWREARDHAHAAGSAYHVCIFPNKETLCWDRHPLSGNLAAPQSVGQMLRQMDRHDLIRFWDGGDSSYFLKYDTHFSYVGNTDYALRIARLIDPDVFGALSREDLGSRLNRECRVRTGDLGRRFDPPLVEPRWSVSAAPGSTMLSNGVSNRGYIEWTVTENAPVQKRVLVFADSYFRAMRHCLTPWVREILLIHTTYYCPDLVEIYRPDFILQSYAERLLAFPPASLTSPVPFDQIAGQNGKTASLDMRAALLAASRQADGRPGAPGGGDATS